MKSKQLADRLGGIDDELLTEARNFARVKKTGGRTLRRFVAAAAVLGLMTCSATVGALAFSSSPEPVYIEKTKEIPVYVEKKQETIDVFDSDITLILPDAWAGKYVCETKDDRIGVYSLAIQEKTDWDGRLFSIERKEGIYPMDYEYPDAGHTIAIADDYTYRLVIPSDVQYDESDADAAAEYKELSRSVKDIKILLSDWLTKNSVNAANWVEGTVTVRYMENNKNVKTVLLDPGDSETVRGIILSQENDREQESFAYDLWFIIDGDEYIASSETGRIQSVDGAYGATIAQDDLQTLVDILF